VQSSDLAWLIPTLSAVLVLGVVLLAWIGWRSQRPKNFVRGVGVIYLRGAEAPWDGLDLALEMLAETVDIKWPGRAELMAFTIRVLPQTSVIVTKEAPSGYVHPSGMPAPAPRTQAEAERIRKVGGTVKRERFMGLGPATYVVELIQNRRDGPDWAKRMGAGSGPVVRAGDSTLFHEVIEHVIPWRLWGSDNRAHTRPDLMAMTDALEQRYRRG